MSKGNKESSMPKNIANTFGDGKLEKGRWNKFDVIAWDFTEKCIGRKCELWDICEYKHRCAPELRDNRPGCSDKCGMQLRYLKNALTGVIILYGKEGRDNNMAEMIRMGYHLLPLYNQLFKFKKVEYAEKELLTISEKGAIKINPIYKEIREIISSLEAVWAKIEKKTAPSRKAKKKENEGDADFLDAVYEVVGSDMHELPMQDTGPEPEQLLDDAEAEVGEGIDFEAVGIADKAPKRKKEKTQAQKERKYKQERKAKRKLRRKKKLIAKIRKEEAEKENLRQLKARIQSDVEKAKKEKEEKAARGEDDED